ncbi:DUF3473 domain-containing protein [Catenovulum sp. SM1970]|nr:XrtA system polysaccharide deacetylase [Marinifaba aquimaris]NTS75956.1 DUF3473 domain-containing protein [Marinifaba aquimaris]
MTVDVEDYFHVSAFNKVIKPQNWDELELRVEMSTNRLLDLFAEHSAKSTFFTLGWVAERCPNLIKRIVDEGHEIASHGYNHQRATEMSPQAFKKDVSDSKRKLEDISGAPVIGYRAPSFSFNDSNQWVYETLIELGFKYSSSTYPIEHDHYGVPHWPRFKHLRDEGIYELPIPTLKKGEQTKGIGGGGYFRLFPYWLSKKRIDRFHQEEAKPYSFYFHPWEIDPEQPLIKEASMKSKFRHYVNLSRMEAKLVKLLKDYEWQTMSKVYFSDES